MAALRLLGFTFGAGTIPLVYIPGKIAPKIRQLSPASICLPAGKPSARGDHQYANIYYEAIETEKITNECALQFI